MPEKTSDGTAPSVAVRVARPDDLEEARALMIEVIAHDYGYDYRTRWHDDVADPRGFYLEHPRQALLVAIDERTGLIVGTAGIRVLRIAAPPHPPEIVARYDRERTAELTRVFVHPTARRRGIGRVLVEAARRWVANAGGYHVIQLHSRTAVDFWRALPTVEILDTRRMADGGPDDGQVYFELAIPPRSAADRLDSVS